MPQDAWEDMLADALHPRGVHARELPALQDHPCVRRRLQETPQATRREGRRLWDITPSPTPPTDTPTPPRKRRRTDTGSTDPALTSSTPGAPRATQHDAPNPPASGAPRLTPRRGFFLGHARAAGRRHSLQPQAAAQSSPGPRSRTHPPRQPQGTTSHRGPQPPRPSLTGPEAPDQPTTAALPAGRTARDPTRPDDPAQHRPPH